MLGAVGCGGDGSIERVAVEGTVSQDGVNVAKGSVSFRPAQGSSGPAAGPAVIQDGVFGLSKERGPASGAYRVVVTLEGPGKLEQMENKGEPSKTAQPGQWQFDVEIPKGQTWRHDFPLTDEHRVATD